MGRNSCGERRRLLDRRSVVGRMDVASVGVKHARKNTVDGHSRFRFCRRDVVARRRRAAVFDRVMILHMIDWTMAAVIFNSNNV